MISEGTHAISAEEYHRDPAPEPSLSASMVKILLRSTPRHAFVAHPRLNPKWQPDHESKFDVGTAAHALMLNDPKAFAVWRGDDWRTKESKEFRDAARAEGKIPLLNEQMARTMQMVLSARQQLERHADAANAFTAGKPEQTLVWQESGTWFRSRLDWLHDGKPTIFDDYKTTDSANPDTWRRIAFSESIAHDIQAAFYRRGVRALGICKAPRMRCIVQEVEEPFALVAVELEPEALELADRRIEQAIAIWRWCLANNSWPGYPAYTVRMAAPAWHESQLMDREISRESVARARGVKHSSELLALANDWQRPK